MWYHKHPHCYQPTHANPCFLSTQGGSSSQSMASALAQAVASGGCGSVGQVRACMNSAGDPPSVRWPFSLYPSNNSPAPSSGVGPSSGPSTSPGGRLSPGLRPGHRPSPRGPRVPASVLPGGRRVSSSTSHSHSGVSSPTILRHISPSPTLLCLVSFSPSSSPSRLCHISFSSSTSLCLISSPAPSSTTCHRRFSPSPTRLRLVSSTPSPSPARLHHISFSPPSPTRLRLISFSSPSPAILRLVPAPSSPRLHPTCCIAAAAHTSVAALPSLWLRPLIDRAWASSRA